MGFVTILVKESECQSPACLHQKKNKTEIHHWLNWLNLEM